MGGVETAIYSLLHTMVVLKFEIPAKSAVVQPGMYFGVGALSYLGSYPKRWHVILLSSMFEVNYVTEVGGVTVTVKYPMPFPRHYTLLRVH